MNQSILWHHINQLILFMYQILNCVFLERVYIGICLENTDKRV